MRLCEIFGEQRHLAFESSHYSQREITSGCNSKKIEPDIKNTT